MTKLTNRTYGHKYQVDIHYYMSHYILLLNWTDQGIRNVKDTIKRADAFRSYLEKKGGKLTDIFYTFGQYDLVIIVDLPNDNEAMSVLLGTGALGNIRSTTLKAFNLEETRKIVEDIK